MYNEKSFSIRIYFIFTVIDLFLYLHFAFIVRPYKSGYPQFAPDFSKQAKREMVKSDNMLEVRAA